MATLNIRGHNVEFPYQTPYEIQKAYMEKVLNCLDDKLHGVLESPTGTGKTLCLIAPVAAWVKKRKEGLINEIQTEFDKFFDDGCETNTCVKDPLKDYSPDIIQVQGQWGVKKKGIVWYTARTHSQLAQTVAEVRKCDIKGLQIRVMGARDQLCINQEVLSEKDSYVKTLKCKELTKAKKCQFYTRINFEKETHKFYQPGEVMDIEDMVAAGKACRICPYYMAKKGNESADIVLLPYNYIIDKEAREANQLNLGGDVVIFDEGHNVPSTCEESYEFEFSTVDIVLGRRNVRELMVHLLRLAEMATEDEELDIAKHSQSATFVAETLQRLEDGLNKLPMSNGLLPVAHLYDFFKEAGIHEGTSCTLLRSIEDFQTDSIKLNLTGSILSTFHLLEKMMHVIFGATVKSFDQAVIDRSFKCGITIDPDRSKSCKKVSLFCFNPSFGVRALLQLGVQSIVITSGTLSPLKNFIYELDLPKPITLENGHIAKKCQVPFVILGTGVNNVRMDASFKNRSDSKYVFSLGMTLTNLISSIPDGVLLLFSSYTMMQNLKDSWESDFGVWNRLNSLKRVFIEPRGKEEFLNCMENYKRAIDSGNGAILMGVLRGKISEGMDFKDQYCRGVFIVGVPFPPVMDPRVKGKEKYSESLVIINPDTKKEERLYGNNNFMSVEAMKATNQAIGRVIRHGGDYGAIILVDYRFCWPRLFCNVSKWLRGNSAQEKNFPETKKLLREFFRDIHAGKLGVREIRCQLVDGNGAPIAGHVRYEEYDHKTAVRTPAPWISAGVPERNAPARSTVEYLDDSPDQDIVSSYSNSSLPNPKVESTSKTLSVLDALESSRSSSVGYREIDMFELSKDSPDKNKRKFRDDREQDFPIPKSPCIERKSPSMLSFPQGSSRDTTQPKRVTHAQFTRLKIKPLAFANVAEPETILIEDEPPAAINATTSEAGNADYLQELANRPDGATKNAEALQIKMLDYFQVTRNLLPAEEHKQFKTSSFKYMKGEIPLSELIVVLDKLFRSPARKKLFKEFGVCVKSKDQELWRRACRTRFGEHDT